MLQLAPVSRTKIKKFNIFIQQFNLSTENILFTNHFHITGLHHALHYISIATFETVPKTKGCLGIFQQDDTLNEKCSYIVRVS